MTSKHLHLLTQLINGGFFFRPKHIDLLTSLIKCFIQKDLHGVRNLLIGKVPIGVHYFK